MWLTRLENRGVFVRGGGRVVTSLKNDIVERYGGGGEG